MDGIADIGYGARGIFSWFRKPPWSAREFWVLPPDGMGVWDVKKYLKEWGVDCIIAASDQESDRVKIRINRADEEKMHKAMMLWHRKQRGGVPGR